jgi:hypothetical protein
MEMNINCCVTAHCVSFINNIFPPRRRKVSESFASTAVDRAETKQKSC